MSYHIYDDDKELLEQAYNFEELLESLSKEEADDFIADIEYQKECDDAMSLL